jgi:DNA-binding transcriptional LysR family regulator
MDIDSLLAFVTVYKERSFSKAAERLSLTQPAITKRIQGLERQLSCKLIERLQRDLLLTEAGEALYPHALSILHEIDNAKHAIKNLSHNVEGELRIVASHHIGLHRLPLILKEFSKRYPEVDLKLNFLDSESAYPILGDNQADIAFITIPDQLSDDYICHLSWDDPMSFICSQHHELASLTSVTPPDLAKHNAILPSRSTLTYRVVEAMFHQSKLMLNASIPTNYLETMKMMAGVGMGWSVLPNTMIDEELKVLPIDLSNSYGTESELTRNLGAVSFRKKSMSNAAKAFIEVAESIWGRQVSVQKT